LYADVENGAGISIPKPEIDAGRAGGAIVGNIQITDSQKHTDK
jgi:hypothetical protein